ncbi:hypothetical protein JCM8547_001503 [Rhodosporidiobolus lusitaniae]
MRGSIALPVSPDRSPLLQTHAHTASTLPSPPRLRPVTMLTWLSVAAICFAAGHFSHTRTTLSASTTGTSPSVSSSLSLLSSSLSLFSPSSHRTPIPSCRPCDIDPSNPLCEYGDSAIRMSRAYEGSGLRVRRFLEKAMRKEEVVVGIIGASVTWGHGIGDHLPWTQRWYEAFQARFPDTPIRLVNGAAPAMTSKFFSYCHATLVPKDADLYLLELDINDETTGETFSSIDALYRALLQLPSNPAVIRLSVLALSFDDMIRGTEAGLVNSQYFDVPVLSIRNWLLPHLMAHPDLAPDFFTRLTDGKPDLRHVNALGHDALADMLTLYLDEQTCLAEQEQRLRSRLQAKAGTLWPQEDVYGMIPRQPLWEKFSETRTTPPVTPLCHFAASKVRPLVPLPPSLDGKDGEPNAWTRMEWNDKAAVVSSTVGSVVRFGVEGTSAGVFVWRHPLSPRLLTPPLLQPGQAVCWVDDLLDGATLIDAYEPNEAAGPNWVMVGEELEPGKHIVSCQVVESTRTGGHEVRIVGVVSH